MPADRIHKGCHFLCLALLQRRNRNAHHLEGGVVVLGPQKQTIIGSLGANGTQQIPGVNIQLCKLPHDFRHCLDIAQNTGGIGAAGRHIIHLFPPGRILGNNLPGGFLPILGENQLRAHHGVQGQIA